MLPFRQQTRNNCWKALCKFQHTNVEGDTMNGWPEQKDRLTCHHQSKREPNRPVGMQFYFASKLLASADGLLSHPHLLLFKKSAWWPSSCVMYFPPCNGQEVENSSAEAPFPGGSALQPVSWWPGSLRRTLVAYQMNKLRKVQMKKPDIVKLRPTSLLCASLPTCWVIPSWSSLRQAYRGVLFYFFTSNNLTSKTVFSYKAKQWGFFLPAQLI